MIRYLYKSTYGRIKVYRELPEEIKQRVREYLESDEFSKAKELHDGWIAQFKQLSRSLLKDVIASPRYP